MTRDLPPRNPSIATGPTRLSRAIAAPGLARGLALAVAFALAFAVVGVLTAPTAFGAEPSTNAAPAGPSLPEFFARLKAATHAATDPALAPLGSDLAAKVSMLSRSLTNSPEATASLQVALASLLGKDDPETLSALRKLAEFKLPPEQLNLLRDVRDVGTAYLVQKNVGTVPGVQNEVAHLILALRQGRTADALEGTRKLAASARIGAPPKAFLEALAGHLTPSPRKPTPPVTVTATP